MKIKYINRNPEAREYNRLTDSVGWGIRDEKIIQQALENTLYSLCVYDGDRLITRIIKDTSIKVYLLFESGVFKQNLNIFLGLDNIIFIKNY